MPRTFPGPLFYVCSVLAIVCWMTSLFAIIGLNGTRISFFVRLATMIGALVFQALAFAQRGEMQTQRLFPWQWNDRKK